MAGPRTSSLSGWSLLLAVMGVLNWARYTSATCYDYNNNVLGPEFQPCTKVAGVISMCCATNRSNPFGGLLSNGVTADRCLPNGLCQNESVNATSQSRYTDFVRNGCTASPVNKAKCLADVCTGETDQGGAKDSASLTPCDGTPTSEYWCCAKNSTACCNTDQKVKLVAIVGAPSTPTSTGIQSSVPPRTDERDANGLVPGVIFAIILGVIVVTGSIIGTIVVLKLRKHRKRDEVKRQATMTGTPPEFSRFEASPVQMRNKPLPRKPMPALGKFLRE